MNTSPNVTLERTSSAKVHDATVSPSPTHDRDLFVALQAALGDEYALEREQEPTAVARVFIARERIFNRAVLVTVLSADALGNLDFERFVSAAERTAGLNHPGIVPPLAIGAAAGLPYVIAPYVPGVTLRTRLVEQPPLTLEEIVSVLRDLAGALDYAHTNGVSHLDISADHILLSQKTALVTDFGIARDIALSQHDGASSVRRLQGSLDFRAPEQLSDGAVSDHRADLFAWGCAAYEMLTGMPAFARDAMVRNGGAMIDDDPAPITLVRRDVPPTLVRLIMRCLSTSAEDRPASAANLLQVLQTIDVSERAIAERSLTPAYVQAVGRKTTSVQPVVDPAPTRAWTTRRAAPFAVAAVVVLAITGWVLTRNPAPREAPLPPVTRPAVLPLSVAVLPITATQASDGARDVGIGLAREFGARLAERGLLVSGRFTAPSLRARGLDPRGVARELGAAFVLTGTFAYTDDSLQLDVALLTVSNGRTAWSAKHNRPLSALPELADDISREVAARVRELPVAPRTTILPPVDADAQLLVLEGDAQLRTLTAASVRAASAVFERAVARDPASARGFAGLALSSALGPLLGDTDAPRRYERALSAAANALALDAGSVDAITATALVHFGRGDNRAADREFKRALRIDSTAVLALSGHALLLSHVDDFAAARLKLARAQRFDAPSLQIRAWLAQVALSQGNLDEAEAASRAVLVSDSSVFSALSVRTDALIGLDRAAAAVAMLDARVATEAAQITELRALLAYACAVAGEEDRAREIMLAMRDASGGALPPLASIAATLAALGDTDSAVGVLERAASRHDATLMRSAKSPRFATLRKDPRAAAVFTRLSRW
jgi:eukaryotic-like serine/threonine-protein kinase